MDGVGGCSSERLLEVRWWGGGALRDLSKNILKQGWVKAKVVHRGGWCFEGVTTPAPPKKISIIHQKSWENRANMDMILLFLAKPLDKHGITPVLITYPPLENP